jgi:UDP-N-acetylglucosamine pyrophosphorylase
MNPAPSHADQILSKMRAAGLGEPVIRGFLAAVRQVAAGDRGLIPEADIEPVADLPRLNELPGTGVMDAGLLRQLAVFKLNGGLGTGMGLDRAKSLLPVRGPDCFLDFIVRQVLHLRQQTASRVPAFHLMNSFSTQADTRTHLERYPDLGPVDQLDFVQSRVPRLLASTLEPLSWPANPELEWCPPGHGDFYPSLLGAGLLDRLVAGGIRFAFISNSDNLGATVDGRLLGWFAQSGLSFVMEVAERTAADRKGGHLARQRRDGRLLLRESAQCPAAELAGFQDIQRHRFFNTNNLWIRLDHLQALLADQGGTLPLPLIRNEKPADPAAPATPRVLQLESAMGAAIACFPGSGAIVVPRTRFAPVKSTADLLTLRSDACEVTPDHRLALVPARQGQPPVVDLDPVHYQVLARFDRCFEAGVPSLVRCDSLKVRGPVRFSRGVVCEGDVEFVNGSPEPRTVAPGGYANGRWEL